MAKVRILLIEDNRMLREGIAAQINGQGDITVVAASDGTGNAVAKATSAKVQVILMDLGLHSVNSLEIVKSIKKALPSVKIIGMGLVASQEDILEFVQAGAEGFILKDANVHEVIKTIRAVVGGETILPPPMTGSLFFQVVEHAILKGKRGIASAVRMTPREKEIIALISDGMTNKQIAQKLNIATFTVKSHVHNILEKLALHSRLQIAMYGQDDTKN